jgi:hypothetical protein
MAVSLVAISTTPGSSRQAVEIGARVLLRDADTIDELGSDHAPAPVEPDDLLATVDEVYELEVVVLPTPGGWVVTALARRADLAELNAHRV